MGGPATAVGRRAALPRQGFAGRQPVRGHGPFSRRFATVSGDGAADGAVAAGKRTGFASGCVFGRSPSRRIRVIRLIRGFLHHWFRPKAGLGLSLLSWFPPVELFVSRISKRQVFVIRVSSVFNPWP